MSKPHSICICYVLGDERAETALKVLRSSKIKEIGEYRVLECEPTFAHLYRCDGCAKQVIGIRFKCAVCEDFDFCSSCFQSSEVRHDIDHKFYVIPDKVPESSSPYKGFTCQQRDPGSPANRPKSARNHTTRQKMRDTINSNCYPFSKLLGTHLCSISLEICKQYGKKIIFVQDVMWKFPPEEEQLPNMKRVFENIAVPLISGYLCNRNNAYMHNYTEECWKRIAKQIETFCVGKKENIHTDIFLSHRQKTGQGIASTLNLKLAHAHKLKVFFDVQAEFDLHDLRQIVASTNAFVFILTNEIFESQYCYEEFVTALYHKRTVIIVKDVFFDIPEELPTMWQRFRYLFYHPEHMIIYSACYQSECAERIVKRMQSLNPYKEWQDNYALMMELQATTKYPVGEPNTPLQGFSMTYKEAALMLFQSKVADPVQKAAAAYCLGRCLRPDQTMKLPDNAVYSSKTLFLTCLQIDPACAGAYNNLAVDMPPNQQSVELPDGRLYTRVELLQETLKYDPHNANAFVNLGTFIHKKTGSVTIGKRQLDQHELFLEALKCNPKHHVALYNLALHMKAGSVLLLPDDQKLPRRICCWK